MTQVWMCSSCHSLNDAVAKKCYKCGTARAVGEYVDGAGRAGAPGTEAVAPPDPSLLGGILFGLVAAILATGLWYWWDLNMSRRFFGMSWLVGAAIAFGVVVGGRGRTSFSLVLFSVILTALALVAGEYLLVSTFLAPDDGANLAGLPIAPPEDVAETLPKLIAAAPLRPLLWAGALFASFIGPWSRLVGDDVKKDDD